MTNIRCPRCDVVVELRPAVVDGKVVDLENSDARRTIVSNARYELEIPYRSSTLPGYTIVDCGNCGGRFVVEHRKGSSDYRYYNAQVVWPLCNTAVATEIPESVAEAVVNAANAHAVGAELASLLAARTALIRLQREQEVASIKELVDKGKLTDILYKQTDEIRLWANIQGHEDVQPGTVDSDDVEELLEYLDIVLRTIYVDPARLKKRQEERKTLKN